ncbi:M1 family metallopeptidase [Pontibacter akesuensis]|uniref:Peptidase family M1 n=1 Tax=Pontibacter akesuensis TaxID=388950 RepID=A0A1I7GSW4_9BACT|nr:M1 family metallopeptidase [Pontibacter akesuensis]GHA55244.1 peptidase M1 [Pontibacter akesuensis]SFU51535.1 Peptidase family M1 [Pontibacter akesuensis]
MTTRHLIKSLALGAVLSLGATAAQAQEFSRQDTLRGSITPERAWWDLTFYDLDLAVNIKDSTFSGSNVIRYKVLEPKQRMQVDLQPPMRIEKVTQNGKELKVENDGNVWYVNLQEPQKVGEEKEIKVFYSGKPQVSENPPWSGGITWQRDQNGRPFIASSNQGDGASLWWPNKDHMYDEPDSMRMSVRVPKGLMDVSNGRLKKVQEHGDGSKTFTWYVTNPINNYGVNVNIADYVHFSDKYKGEKGVLDLEYYVLRNNLEKAKEQFKQVPLMLQAFEHWFGPYPFYEDSYKLVEAPYLGMEHQSSVTYGNGYQNGYLGRDLSGTGWGKKFDFIIIHESGHEWFANNITYKDIADMWIHESFTNYSESLFLDYHYGTKAANEYIIGLRNLIQNDKPIIGKYNVNHSGSGDMYPKGANMLHNLRQIVNNDEKWRSILRGLNKDFYHQTVATQQIEEYLSQKIGRNLTPVFDQYLRDVRIPELQYKINGKELQYRWANTVSNFDMPVKVTVDGREQWLEPTTTWKELKTAKKNPKVEVDKNFYVTAQKVTTS